MLVLLSPGGSFLLRPAVAVPVVVGQEAVGHGLSCYLLQTAVDGGVDLEPVVICSHAVSIKHLLAHHLGRVMGGETQLFVVVLGGIGFRYSCAVLRLVDIAQVAHAPENPVAALFARNGPTDRVVA